MATDVVSNEPIQAVPALPAVSEIPPEHYAVVDHLVTEDNTPVGNVFSEKQMRLLTETLYNSWTDNTGQRTFVAMSNVGMFFAIHRPPLVPDVLLSMKVRLPADINIREKRYRSYFIWEYGKPPDVVIEVVSNREGGEDTEKLDLYAEIGVRDYAIYDPERLLSPELLCVFRLVEGEYCKMDEPIWFPKVGLGLRVWQGAYEDWDSVWLRWVDAQGVLVPTGRERAETERERAETERERAEAARQIAASERERAERLAEQLRQLGVEPLKP